MINAFPGGLSRGISTRYCLPSVSFLAKYALKAGYLNFKQFMIDYEVDLTEGTIVMNYGYLDFDITNRKVECDPAVAELIES